MDFSSGTPVIAFEARPDPWGWALPLISYYLGIDGGGTSTAAWLADDSGRVLARAAAGASNPLKVGFEAAQRELLSAARRASRQARLKAPLAAVSPLRARRSLPRLEAVCVGLAGVDRPQVHRRFDAWLRKSIPARCHHLTSDAAIALQAAIGKSAGIIVVSGTGSIAYGRDSRGRVLRSGGWGIPFDDAGSGYDLGRKAIVTALRALDGRGPQTVLGRKICNALGLRDIPQVVLHSFTPHEIAGLAALVLAAARQGDRVSGELCEEAGRDLADLAVALIKRLGWQRSVIPVVCSGGVFRSSVQIRRSFVRHLRQRVPRARVMLLRRLPVEGALAVARELADSGKREQTR